MDIPAKQVFSSQSYRQLADSVDAAYTWLSSLGLRLDSTRIRRYRDCLTDLAEHHDNGTLHTVETKTAFPALITAAMEASDLVFIHRGLCKKGTPEALEKLRTFIGGEEYRPLHHVHDPSRDIGFELVTASRFVLAGFEIDFATEADLRIVFEGREIFVECKRLKSTKQIRKRIRSALKQLHRRYVSADKPEDARGLLALSIGAAVVPRNHLLVKADEKAISRRLGELVDAFIERHKGIWHLTKDRRTIGTLVHLDIAAVNEGKDQLTTCRETGMNNNCIPDSPDYMLLMQLGRRLSNRRFRGSDLV